MRLVAPRCESSPGRRALSTSPGGGPMTVKLFPADEAYKLGRAFDLDFADLTRRMESSRRLGTCSTCSALRIERT